MAAWVLPPILLLLLLLNNRLHVAAWGQEGHHMTCMIAQERLSVDAKQAILKLVPSGDFVELCSWADEVRRSFRFRWSGPLHYIDTPDGLCTYNYERDCHDGRGTKDACVAGAINNYTSQLQSQSWNSASRFLLEHKSHSSSSSSYNLTEALLFLAHYVGDIHQPLHVGFTSDAGGNSIHVRWFGRKYNLHHIWDTEFIDKARQLYYPGGVSSMASAISRNVSATQEAAWGKCIHKSGGDQEAAAACTDSFARESIAAACKWAYNGASPDSNLADDYFLSRLPIVEQRLAQGGVRLAALLNTIFASPRIRRV